jgi:hypothetical protein
LKYVIVPVNFVGKKATRSPYVIWESEIFLPPFMIDLMSIGIVNLTDIYFYKAYGDQPSLILSHNESSKNLELNLQTCTAALRWSLDKPYGMKTITSVD